MLLDGRARTIVGVMPPAFGGEAFWTPYVVAPQQPGTVTIIAVTARLADGVSLEAASAEANVLGLQQRGYEPTPGAPPRFEIVRQLDQTTASLALGVAGGVLGTGLAYGGVRLLKAAASSDLPERFARALGPTILPRLEEISVDPVVLLFLFGLSLATGLLFGVLPALRLSRF